MVVLTALSLLVVLGKGYQTKLIENEERTGSEGRILSWSGWWQLTCEKVTFTRCTAGGKDSGGAIYYEFTEAGLNCTNCVFDACSAGSQYGSAVFSFTCSAAIRRLRVTSEH